MNKIIIAQIVGALVVMFGIIGNNQLKESKILFYNVICNILNIIQYFLLGAYTGTICCFLAIGRNLAFAQYKKKIPLYILLVYYVLVILVNIPFIHCILDILPVFNIMLFAYGLWNKNIYKLKIYLIFIGLFGVIYDLYNHAYTSVLNEANDFICGIIGTIRLNKTKKLYKGKYKKRKTVKI